MSAPPMRKQPQVASPASITHICPLKQRPPRRSTPALAFSTVSCNPLHVHTRHACEGSSNPHIRASSVGIRRESIQGFLFHPTHRCPSQTPSLICSFSTGTASTSSAASFEDTMNAPSTARAHPSSQKRNSGQQHRSKPIAHDSTAITQSEPNTGRHLYSENRAGSRDQSSAQEGNRVSQSQPRSEADETSFGMQDDAGRPREESSNSNRRASSREGQDDGYVSRYSSHGAQGEPNSRTPRSPSSSVQFRTPASLSNTPLPSAGISMSKQSFVRRQASLAAAERASILASATKSGTFSDILNACSDWPQLVSVHQSCNHPLPFADALLALQRFSFLLPTLTRGGIAVGEDRRLDDDKMYSTITREAQQQATTLLDQLLQPLLPPMHVAAASVDAYALTAACVAMSRTRFAQPYYLQRISGESVSRLESYTAQQLAATCYSLAKLGWDPGEDWRRIMCGTSVGTLAGANATELSNILWAFARWGHAPPSEWLEAFGIRVIEVAPGMDEHHLTTLLWAWAMLKSKPQQSVLETCMVECQVRFPSFSAKSHATVAWSLVCLGVQPPAFWIEDFTLHALTPLGRTPGNLDSLAFSNIAWALSNWRATPSHTWLASFTSAAARVLPRQTAHSTAVLVTGLTDLNARPSIAWVSLMLESFHSAAFGSQQDHRDSGGSSLSKPVQSAQPLSYIDKESEDPVRRSGGGGPSASCSDIVAVLYSASRFLSPPLQDRPEDWRPERKWLLRYRPLLADLADASRLGFSTLSANELLDLIVALTDLYHLPGDDWLQLHSNYCTVLTEEYSAYQMRLLMQAYETLDGIDETYYLPLKNERY